jgi:hypothetical protein
VTVVHSHVREAVFWSSQRQAYQDALLRGTRQTAGAVLKDVVHVVCEVMRQRELARLKREAEERARLEQEAFVSCGQGVLSRLLSFLVGHLPLLILRLPSSSASIFCGTPKLNLGLCSISRIHLHLSIFERRSS